MSKHVEIVVIANNFKQIAKPFPYVQIEILYDVSNGMHENGLEKMKHHHERVCNV